MQMKHVCPLVSAAHALTATATALQGNLACTYQMLGRFEEALPLQQDVYSARLKRLGEENRETLVAATCYANSLVQRQRFEEVKVLMRKMIPVARRFLGENTNLTLKMRWIYAMALYEDPSATLDDVREAVETLESIARSWKLVLGEAHPEMPQVQGALKDAREALATRAA